MAGTLQSLCWASAAFGGIASSYFSGSLVQAWGPRGVFALTAVFPLVVSAAAVLIDEQPAAGPRFKADRTYLSEAPRAPALLATYAAHAGPSSLPQPDRTYLNETCRNHCVPNALLMQA